jgi:hypothetical protein
MGATGTGAASYPAWERRPACFEDEKASASLKIGAAISSIATKCREEHCRRVLGDE